MKKNNIVNRLSTPELDKLKQSKEFISQNAKQKELAKKSKGLVPASKLSKEDRTTLSHMAGVASAEKRKNSVLLASTLELLMQLPLVDEDITREILKNRGIEDNLLTETTAICFSQLQRAKQDSKSFEVLRDTIGQKPVEKQVLISNELSPSDIIRKHFSDMLNN